MSGAKPLHQSFVMELTALWAWISSSSRSQKFRKKGQVDVTALENLHSLYLQGIAGPI
jgi:hypothetical protein